MNSRERVYKSILFQNPDRIPISHAVMLASQLKHGEALEEILEEYHDDFGWKYMENLPLEDYTPMYRKGINTDDFGVVWQVEFTGVGGIPIKHPLSDLSQYKNYNWPEIFYAGPPIGRLYSGHKEGYSPYWYSRGGWIKYFQQIQDLCGMETLFLHIGLKSKELYRLLDDLMEFNLDWIKKWIQLDYDGIHFADDWGSQSRLMIKPSTWRSMFKPRYAEMFSMVRKAKKHVWMHSDGFVNEIIGDFLEIGVDVINLQVSVVGHDWIERNLQGRVAIRTDIDRQNILPFGSPNEVNEEVQRTIEVCGSRDGGIIACGEIGPDVPLENVRAMYEAFLEYGTYKT
jgi:hypothetical protein